MRKGFSLIEAILAGSLLALTVTVSVGALAYGRESTALAGARSRAASLASEGLEAVRSMRDGGFAGVTDGTHGLALSGGQWTFSGSQDVTGIFTRQVTVASIDERRKTVTSTVTWQQNPQRTGQVALTTRLTRWNAAVGTWASPYAASWLDFLGTTDGLKIQTSGNFAYVVRAGGSPDFLVVDVTTPSAPSVVGSLDLTGTPTNIALSGSVAYVSSREDGQELQIVNVSVPAAPTVLGTFNATGAADALGVFAVGTTVYLVRASSSDNELVSVNAAVPALPLQISSLNLGADGNEVAVIGSDIFIASSHDTQELQVALSGLLGALSLNGTEDLSGTADALSLAAFSSTVVLGRSDGVMHTISVSTPSNPSPLGSFDAGGAVNDVSLGNSNGHAHLATSDPDAEFQVVDISTPSSPTLVGLANPTGTDPLYGVAHNAAKNRTFAVGAGDAREFMTFAP